MAGVAAGGAISNGSEDDSGTGAFENSFNANAPITLALRMRMETRGRSD